MYNAVEVVRQIQPYREANGSRKYDVFYMHHEDDKKAKSILVKLRENGIGCCTLEEHCAGKPKFTAAQELLSDSRKVVLAVSDWFINCKELLAVAESIVCGIHAEKKRVITLRTTPQKYSFCKYRFLQLTHIITALGDVTETDDIQLLVQKIEEPVLEFCNPIGTYTRISDILLLRGLSYQQLEWSAYGLLVASASRILQIDVQEYINHQKLYEHYNINGICGKCKHLSHVDTTVSLTLASETPSDVFREVKPVFTDLCAKVIDTLSTGKTVWSLACAVNENFKAEHVTKLRELYFEAFDAIGSHSLAQVKNLKYPQFCTEGQRLKSYGEERPGDNAPSALKLAAAGFFCDNKINWARCYFCGAVHTTWKRDDDPLIIHATNYPACGFIAEQFSPEFIKQLLSQRAPGQHGRNANDARYFSDAHSTLERRISTLRDMRAQYLQELTGTNEENIENLEDHKLKIAESGFYYCGPGPRIACFACGVRMFRISVDKEPWVVHAKVSPNCRLVRQMDPNLLKVVRTAQTNGHSNCQQPLSFDFVLKTYDEDSNRRILPENIFQPGSF